MVRRGQVKRRGKPTRAIVPEEDKRRENFFRGCRRTRPKDLLQD